MKKVFASLACAFALCMALFGLSACGNSSSTDTTADNMKNFIGTWDLYEITSEDSSQAISHDTISALQNWEMYVFINLNEDGSSSLFVYTASSEGTWTATDAKTASVTLQENSEPSTFTIDDDGYLEWAYDDQVWVFAKSDTAKNVDDYLPVTYDEEENTDFTEQTIADDEYCTATATRSYSDTAGDPGYEIEVTNNTDGTIYFTCDDDFTTSNGTYPFYGGINVEAGETATTFFYFSRDEIGGGIETLSNVSGTFAVWDGSTYETLATYDVTL